MIKKIKPLIPGGLYEGEYVALDGFNGSVVAHGFDPCKVIDEARAKGYESPCVVFVPRSDTTYIYRCSA